MINVESFQGFGKDGLDSAVKSATAMSKGMQAVAAEVVDYSKKSLEDGAANVEKLVGAKSLDKAIEIQTAYVKSSYEAGIARLTKIGEIYTDMAKEAYKPYEGLFAKAAPAK